MPHTDELRSLLEEAEETDERIVRHLLRSPMISADTHISPAPFPSVDTDFQQAFARLRERVDQPSSSRSMSIMNSVQTRTLSTAQNATWPRPEAHHPPLSWTDEALTPDQFFRFATNKPVVWGGARQLLVAVLFNAVNTLFRYRHDRTKRGMRILQETLDWFRSADRQWLYSFENICIHLNLDADDLRRGLKRFSDPAVVSLAPVLRARGKSDRMHSPRTVRHGENDGQNSQGASLVGRTRRNTSE